MSKIIILNEQQIAQKLKRMAYEIWEKNSDEKQITIIGIEDGGKIVAENIIFILKEISPLKIHFSTLRINKINPLEDNIDIPIDINGKSVMLIDDVANSGKTLLYSLKPLLKFLPKKIEIAVLVDRKHKNYPILPDIIGLSVSTTLQDNIVVTHKGEKITGAHLE